VIAELLAALALIFLWCGFCAVKAAASQPTDNDETPGGTDA
jgi:hypothetical protein